jgi:hypothetical protein
MTRHFPLPDMAAATPASLLVDAARCWRTARDAGQPGQPSLSGILAAHERVMLIPVLDSLFCLYEAALDRPIEAGTVALSTDEHLLVDLFEGSSPCSRLNCPQVAGHALDCALCSTRIMLALTCASPPPNAI